MIKILGMSIACLLILTTTYYFSSQPRQLGYGVYGVTNPIILNYQTGAFPHFSHDSPSAESLLTYSAEYKGKPLFKTWRDNKSCGFRIEDNEAYSFVLPRSHEYEQQGINYKRVVLDVPYSKFANSGSVLTFIRAHKDGKIVSEFVYDNRLGIREFAIYDTDGREQFRSFLTAGDGILIHCTGLSWRDIIPYKA